MAMSAEAVRQGMVYYYMKATVRVIAFFEIGGW